MVREVFVELVEEFKSKMSITSILELFGVSSSTYYRWKKEPSITELNDYEKVVIMKCKETKYDYGYRTIYNLLKQDGISIGKNTVQRIMQKFDLQCRIKPKKSKPYIGKESLVANNILDRDFKATRPLEKLVTDITYFTWASEDMYLSSIMDLFNGEIIAYTLGYKQDLDFVIDTLNQLPDLDKPCLIHSDQGSVYTSGKYQKMVKRKSITMSMSRKGTPADNAPIESFHSVLKSETFYRYPELKSSTEIISQTVINFIHHYNNTRVQAKLGYMSPIQYRETHIPA